MGFFSGKSIDAKLVGPNLVASFHRAQPPLVWRFDLERNHSFTIALQGDDGDWELGITSAKGEFYPIVHFANHEDAEAALNVIQKLLMQSKGSKLWSALKVFFIFVIVAVILLIAGLILVTRLPSLSASLTPGMLSSLHVPAPNVTAAPVPEEPPQAFPSGIPLSADEVLKPPK